MDIVFYIKRNGYCNLYYPTKTLPVVLPAKQSKHKVCTGPDLTRKPFLGLFYY